MDHATAVRRALKEAADKKSAEKKQRFFKTGPGEYGEGDIFIGVTVPDQRKVARQFFSTVSLCALEELLADPVHEHRKTALFILVEQYKKAHRDPARQQELALFYLDHLDGVNNWDLVDCSAQYILGHWLFEQQDPALTDRVLNPLITSGDLWRERTAVLASFHFIRQGSFEKTLELAEQLLRHPHDLIHKAVGWMLREIGNRNKTVEEAFLEHHCRQMPRTMLRYAIEKFPPEERACWMQRSK